MAGKTANISLEIDSGIKQRAMAVLEARGMSLSGAIRRMVTLGILEHRIPFEVTRDPVFAGAGMTEALAERCGIDKDAPVRSGIPTGVIVKMTPELKKEMRDYCRDMCITPNALTHLFFGFLTTPDPPAARACGGRRSRGRWRPSAWRGCSPSPSRRGRRGRATRPACRSSA
jgi:addiction module RelB/DinJ family antitoxin